MALAEGEVGTGEGSIEYSAVTSCLTITCLLDDAAKTHVGGHASLMRKGDHYGSTEILDRMSEKIPGERTVIKILIAGALGSWHPDFLTDTPYIDDLGNKNYDPVQIGPCDSEVASHFGVDSGVVTSENKEGGFTITLEPDQARQSQTVTRADLESGWKDANGAITSASVLVETDAVQNPDNKWFSIVSIDGSNFTISG
jgi:hypothetical protein